MGALALVCGVASCHPAQPPAHEAQVYTVPEVGAPAFDAVRGDRVDVIMDMTGDPIERCLHMGGEPITDSAVTYVTCEGVDF